MTASSNPFKVSGTLSFPPDEGQQAVPVVFGLTGQYKSVLDTRLALVGSGTTVVPFGSVGAPGAKLALVEYEAEQGASPIQLKFNGGSDPLELSAGGFFSYGSPNPVTGITSMSIVRTGDATVRVRLFG